MNVNPLIETALASLNLPVEPDVYIGTADHITYNYSDERPALHADDTDRLDETTVQVHYFTRGNPHPTKKAIRRLLKAAGFSIVTTQQFYEDDTKYTHVVVEVSINGEIDDQED